MTVATVGDRTGVDFGDFNFGWLVYGTRIEQKPDAYTIDLRDGEGPGLTGVHRFFGAGLTYDDSGALTGGVVDRWEGLADLDGGQIFSIAGLAMPASEIADGMAHSTYAATTLFAGDDSIAGGAGGDGLWGFNGDDTISGGDGDDTIAGGGPAGAMSLSDPADHLFGYAFSAADGANVLRGGGGNDTIQGGGGFDDINGNTGNDVARGGPGDDWVLGGQDDDNLFGDEGGDILNGNLGNDTVDGGTGADTVRGGQGADSLNGGAGDDWISGDKGADTVAGGAGADVFHTFTGAGLDRVVDFNRAEGDRIAIDPGIDNITIVQAGADTIVYLGEGVGFEDGLILVGVSASSLTGGWYVAA